MSFAHIADPSIVFPRPAAVHLLERGQGWGWCKGRVTWESPSIGHALKGQGRLNAPLIASKGLFRELSVSCRRLAGANALGERATSGR